MMSKDKNPSLRSGQATAISLIAGLNRIVAVQECKSSTGRFEGNESQIELPKLAT